MNTHTWIEALGWTLIHFLWQGAAVAALLWLLLQFGFRKRASLRYLAGCGSLLLLVILAAGTFSREIAKSYRHNSSAEPFITQPLSSNPNATALRIDPSTSAPTRATSAPISSVAESSFISTPPITWHSIGNRLESFLPWIVGVWITGVALGFLRLFRCWNVVQKLRRSGQPLNDPPWPASLARLCDLLRFSRPVRLVASAAVQVPMVIGWLKPVILLPCSIVTGLPREQVEAIVAHELAHIRRHDYFINVLQNVIETLFFFHPAVWWISGQIRREREHCCDDLASVACGGVLPYVQALAALEVTSRVQQRLALAVNGGSLLARVRRLLGSIPSEGPGNGSYVATIAALALIVAVALPLALGQAPNPKPSVEKALITTNPGLALNAAPIPGRHPETRTLVELWSQKFSGPMFAIAMNTKVQRKSPPGKPVGSAPPKAQEVRFEDPQLEHSDRPSPSIPAAALQRLAKHVDQYIAQFPGEEADKFRPLLPQLKANQQRSLQETSALLDQFCDITSLPVHWLAVEEQASERQRRIPKANAVTDPHKDIVYGPASPIGLRAAWIFRPMKDEYAIGEALTSRVMIHNAGPTPVEFIASTRLQDAQWSVVDGKGNPIRLLETRYARAGEQRSRLAPGESLELTAFGLGIGAGEFDQVYEDGPIAMKLPARAGDFFRFKWVVNLQAAWTLGDDDAAKPVPVKLESGEVKFRVSDPPTEGPKPPGVATKDGLYVISPGVKLRIHQIRMMLGRGTINGVEQPVTGVEIKSNDAHLNVDAARSKDIRVRLPKGDASYVIAWERGATTLWVGEADCVRKLDISTVGRFPAAEILESIDPLQRVEFEKLLETAGTGIPEQRWNWDEPGDFGGIPDQVRAALVQHRPKADPKAEAKLPNFPANESDPRLPWKATGRVTDRDGRPMPDVEIWVHAGLGSLHQTGLARTDVNGRYFVNFGPGVRMEKESSQLQVAIVTAHRPGFFEKNLSRHGQAAAAMRAVSEEDLKSYDISADQLFLPEKSRELDFVMLPGATVRGRLLGTGSFPALPPQDYRGKEGEKPIAGHEKRDRAPLSRWKVWLTGKQLPPGAGVFASAETDDSGRFEFRDVPTGFTWQLEADSHFPGKNPRSPEIKVGGPGEVRTELELDEKQTALQFLPVPRKPPGPGAMNEWRLQVIDGETGEPIPNALVKFARLEGVDHRPPEETRSDAGGFARIYLRPKSMAVLEVIVPGRWGASALSIGDVGQGNSNHLDPSRPKVIQLWKGTLVKGRLLQPNGTPLPGATLNVGTHVEDKLWLQRAGLEIGHNTSASQDSQNWAALVKTAADGSFEATVPPPSARSWIRINTMEIAFGITAPPATKAALESCIPFVMEVRARDAHSAERDGQLNFGDLRMKKGVTIRGRIDDAEGRALAGIGLQISNPHIPLGGRSARSGGDGRFEFRPVAPGSFTLIADSRFSPDGNFIRRDIHPVFVAQQVILPEGSEFVEVVVRAVPHEIVEFDWIDRRKNRGLPVSFYGGFRISGSLPMKDGAPTPWSGMTQKITRDGKEFLTVAVPKGIIEPMLALPTDALVSPSYEDDSLKFGPGTRTIQDLTTQKRRVIYGDDPR